MSGRLQGLSVLVIGGGSGIGRGVVDAYVGEGALVTVLERSEKYAGELTVDLGNAVSLVLGDATDAATVAQAVSVAGERGPLRHVTSCVGVFDSYASLRDMTASELAAAADEIWRVNVLSALLAANSSYPALRATGGSLTLTLSESAFGPHGGGVLYGSSKWALRGVVTHLARDFAPEVRVNGVAPGGTTGTRLAGLRSLDQRHTADQLAGRDERIRAGNALQVVPRPQDHAGAYVYLADPEAARIVTGVIVNTDGGRS